MAERDLVCKVCGREFTPRSYNKKVVKTMSGKHYDTFDCPRCGCQVIAHERIVDGQNDLYRCDDNGRVSYPRHESVRDVFTRVTNVIYDSYEDITNVMGQLNRMLEMYSCVTVADYIELTGVRDAIPFMAYKYGWVHLNDMKIIRRDGGGYELSMPLVLKLDQKE